MIKRVLVSLRACAKRFVLLSVGLVMLIGLTQPAATAAPLISKESMQVSSPDELEAMRAQRRAAQSKASSEANDEVQADSLDEVLNEKLNFEEITEENVAADKAPNLSDRKAVSK